MLTAYEVRFRWEDSTAVEYLVLATDAQTALRAAEENHASAMFEIGITGYDDVTTASAICAPCTKQTVALVIN